MIKRKKKTCKQCNTEQILFGKGLCHSCYRTTQRKPKPISDKQADLLKEYKVVRDAFMSEHPYCQAKVKGCQTLATDVHHIGYKVSREDYLNTGNFLAVCRSCHDWIHANDKEAKELGLLKSRLW